MGWVTTPLHNQVDTTLPSTAMDSPSLSITMVERTSSSWYPWGASYYYRSGFVLIQDSLHRTIANMRGESTENDLVAEALPNQRYIRHGDFAIFGQVPALSISLLVPSFICAFFSTSC